MDWKDVFLSLGKAVIIAVEFLMLAFVISMIITFFTY